MAMENYGNFHTQLVSIVEVLANTAVLEICKLVDDGYTHLRLEVSRTQRENLELKSKLRLMEVGAPVPPLGSCPEKGHSADSLLGGQDGETDLLEEKPVVVIKAEQLEEELTGCIMGERHRELPASGMLVECTSLAPESAGAGGDGGCHAQPGVEFLTSDPGSSHASRSEWASSSPCADEDAAGMATPSEEDGPSLDSFHDLFSSPDVAQALSAPGLWEGGAEERLASAFSFRTSSSSSVTTARDPQTAESDGRGHRDAPPCARGQFSGGPVAPPLPHPGHLRQPFLHLQQLHAQRLHPPAAEQPFRCGVCGKHFSQSSHIKRHMSVHTGERPFGCSVCGKRFSLLGNMVRHQALHVRKEPHGTVAAL